MIILIFYFLTFIHSIIITTISNHIEKEVINTEKKINIYYPNNEDYKFWTEENDFEKKILDIKSFSIKKYYSQNFFKDDRFIINNIKNHQNNIKKMFLFEDPFFSYKKIRYFDVKTPISEIFYINNSFQEKVLSGFFSKNIDEKINYSIEYRNFYLAKDEFNFENKKNLFLSTFNYKNEDKYKFWSHYIHQKFDIIKEKENTILDQKIFNYNRFYVGFLKKFFFPLKNSFFLKNYIEYSKFHFYQLKNKMNHFHLKNGLFLILKKKESTIEVGSIFNNRNYLSFYEYNNKMISRKKNINNFSLAMKISYPINNILKFHSDLKWMSKKYYYIEALFNTYFDKKFQFNTKLSIIKNDNNFINFLIFRNNHNYYKKQENRLFFDTEKTINFSFFYKKNYNIIFKISRLENSNNEMKNDFKHYNNVYLMFNTIHNIWKFQFNNIFLYHKTNLNSLIFDVPNFLLRNTIFYKDNYFNKALSMQTGFSIQYLNNFFYKKYSYPFDLFTFYKKEECFSKKIEEVPFIDYFINFKIYRIIFYFNIQQKNINNNKKYFFKTGFLWNLFT
ncbi:putative porin [Blattabacterium cuenoti]|uniref:putative porin n=1 Tax=Blattabacterium cuenoti TaxID=1653831 RepID=UPI00163B6BEC|nr:putative porin [Blattabacterium cuenoti]